MIPKIFRWLIFNAIVTSGWILLAIAAAAIGILTFTIL